MSLQSHPPRMHVHRTSVRTPREHLTTRDLTVIHYVATGLKNAEIAAIVHTSEAMIKNHLRRIYDLLGLDNRVQLALWHEHELYAQGGTEL